MRSNRRRQRRIDPLAHPDVIQEVLNQLRKRLPEHVPVREKQVIRLLTAVRNIERRPATDTRRGRPSKWKRKDLLRIAGQLRTLLDRETKGRVSLNSFTGLYIRVLEFPKDVIGALTAGEVTLFEAAQLARLNERKLGVSSAEARDLRGQILKAHVLIQGSQASLQARVNEQLGAGHIKKSVAAARTAVGTDLIEELLELDPYDTRHLFWEELRRIAFVLREITPEDIDDSKLDEFLSASDRLSGVLAKIQKRRRQRENQRTARTRAD